MLMKKKEFDRMIKRLHRQIGQLKRYKERGETKKMRTFSGWIEVEGRTDKDIGYLIYVKLTVASNCKE